MTPREDFVRCAREQVGKPYRWATAGPKTFDCSGLVAYCYQQVTGKSITHASSEQFHIGKPVDQGALEAADLVFWGHGQADHVGIYVGSGDVVNALNEERGVIVSRVGAEYGMPYLGARRIFVADPRTTPPPEESDRPKRPRRKHRRTNL